MPVDIPYPEEEVPGLVACVVANTPTTTGDKLYVTVPAFASNDRIEVNWEPHGGTYPTAGTAGVIMQDNANQWWLLMWAGGWT